MGAYAYIFVAGFVIIGGLTAVAMKSDTKDANSELYGVQFKEEARDAAVTGMNLTIRKIVMSGGPWTNAADYALSETEYRKAKYETSVSIVGAGDTVDVTAVGTKSFINKQGSGADTTHTIEARIVRTNLAGGVPPGFDVAILVDESLRINGTFEARSIDPNQNADVHANGLLETRGNSFLVEGYGSYTNAARIRNGENFQPNYDWNGADMDVVYQDSIPVPTIDIDAFRTESQTEGVYNAGDVDVDQAYLNSLAGADVTSFGELASKLGLAPEVGTDAEHPFIFFSEGEIGFTGDVTMDGFGAFVSVTDIMINSNTVITGEIGESFFGYPTTQMGIFTAGDATINGGAEIQATVYIGGTALFNGDATITGGAIIHSISNMLGSFVINWAGPNEGIVRNFGGWREVLGPVIAAWAEW